jgi:hypothetical protein
MRLGRRYGFAPEPGLEACFVRSADRLARERVLAALIAAMPERTVELIDFDHRPVPSGGLRFEKSVVAGGEVLLRGSVGTPGPSGYPVWALVRIQTPIARVAGEGVRRGDPVRVEVSSGLTRVILQADAQGSGRPGQVIAVRNPSNGKILHVTIAGHGSATLAADLPGQRLSEGEIPCCGN